MAKQINMFPCRCDLVRLAASAKRAETLEAYAVEYPNERPAVDIAVALGVCLPCARLRVKGKRRMVMGATRMGGAA